MQQVLLPCHSSCFLPFDLILPLSFLVAFSHERRGRSSLLISGRRKARGRHRDNYFIRGKSNELREFTSESVCMKENEKERCGKEGKITRKNIRGNLHQRERRENHRIDSCPLTRTHTQPLQINDLRDIQTAMTDCSFPAFTFFFTTRDGSRGSVSHAAAPAVLTCTCNTSVNQRRLETAPCRENLIFLRL